MSCDIVLRWARQSNNAPTTVASLFNSLSSFVVSSPSAEMNKQRTHRCFIKSWQSAENGKGKEHFIAVKFHPVMERIDKLCAISADDGPTFTFFFFFLFTVSGLGSLRTFSQIRERRKKEELRLVRLWKRNHQKPGETVCLNVRASF